MYSKIIEYVYNYFDKPFVSFQEIEEAMDKIKIKCKIKDNRIIFNYSIFANFSNPVVREARGIIFAVPRDVFGYIYLQNWQVICWGFDKFANYGESYAAEIDWQTAQIQEKIDGSIIKLYYYKDEWHWSTMSTIDAKDAQTKAENISFMNIIKFADNFKDINFSKLCHNYTYIFELVSPETRVVINYPNTHLYHIGTRSNITGKEAIFDIGIDTPKIYDIHSPDLAKVIKVAEKLNHGECLHEGFVVRDANFNRIKIKNPSYLMLHHSLSTLSLTKEFALEALMNNDEERILTILSYPIFKVKFKWYDYQYSRFMFLLKSYISLMRTRFKGVGQNRKTFALSVKNDTFKTFAFMAIDNPDMTAEDMVRKLGVKKIEKYIEDPTDD